MLDVELKNAKYSPVLHKLYFWSYCLRIEMQAVYQQTINRYAMGQHNRGIDDAKNIAKILII